MKKWFVLIIAGLLLLTNACSVNTPKPTATPMPTYTSVPTKTPIPAETEGIEKENTMVTPDPKVEAKDLTAFVDAWNSREVQRIYSLYTEDARVYTKAGLRKLMNGDSVEDAISPELISSFLEATPLGMNIHIQGSPISIHNKLVAFTYRLENATEGYNASGLLRYEGEKIYQHVFLVSENLSSNDSPSTGSISDSTVGKMIEAWSLNDQQATAALYANDAVILSDEDIAKVPWRDFEKPPTLAQLLDQFAGWEPAQISPAISVDNTAVFAWRWGIRTYPIAYGVRLIEVEDGLITYDIRYAIRPWEAQGGEFSSGEN